MVMIRKKKRRNTRSQVLPRDPQKEKVYRSLTTILSDAGYTIRREELKRGSGWSATSGACIHQQTPHLFVDRRLTQDDQIAFLVERMIEYKVVPTDEQLIEFPEVIQNQFRSEIVEQKTA